MNVGITACNIIDIHTYSGPTLNLDHRQSKFTACNNIFLVGIESSLCNTLLFCFHNHSFSVYVLTEVCMYTEDLAVDWVSNNLYWTDGYHTTLEVLDLDAMHRAELIRTGANTAPISITLDPSTR